MTNFSNLKIEIVKDNVQCARQSPSKHFEFLLALHERCAFTSFLYSVLICHVDSCTVSELFGMTQSRKNQLCFERLQCNGSELSDYLNERFPDPRIDL